ncbi:MAG: hypothetical protein NTW32_26945 [Chloroflexi bacterium]|nr:hypothetical protein [Chloroflexota bacterium]
MKRERLVKSSLSRFDSRHNYLPAAAVPVNPRDVEIYRLHEVPALFGGTEEKRTIPSLAKEFGLKE